MKALSSRHVSSLACCESGHQKAEGSPSSPSVPAGDSHSGFLKPCTKDPLGKRGNPPSFNWDSGVPRCRGPLSDQRILHLGKKWSKTSVSDGTELENHPGGRCFAFSQQLSGYRVVKMMVWDRAEWGALVTAFSFTGHSERKQKLEDPPTHSCWRKNKIMPTSVQRLNSSESDHNGPSLESPLPLPSKLLPFFKELRGHLFLPLSTQRQLSDLGLNAPTQPRHFPDPHCGAVEKAKSPRLRPLGKP